jgi:putative peptidoglycan lipid II flippase
MGTSLGYGQSVEYQYFNAPQPSQPIARIRQERLQRLREERQRRQPQSPQRDFSRGEWARPLQRPSQREAVARIPDVLPKVSKFTRDLTGNVANVIQPAIQSMKARSSTDPGAGGAESGPMETSATPHVSALTENTAQALALSPKAASGDSEAIERVRVGKAALILTSAFIASRVLGLLRTSLFAFVFGTSSTSDAYLQAFLIPELIFNIVSGGALLSAFIPVFTYYTTSRNDEKTAWHITSSILNLALAAMGGLALFAIVLAPALVPLYNPGLQDQDQLALITALTRIMLLQAVVLSAGVVTTSVLNAKQDFRLPAIGTVLYNVGLLLGLFPGMVFALSGQHNDSAAIFAATWGVVLGAILQVGVQVPGLMRAGMKYTFTFDWRHPGVRQIARQMVPRTLNAAMLYISIFVDRGLIQLLVVLLGLVSVNGLITQYYQAFQLVLLPLGVFGMSMSTAAFPTLADNVARGRLDRARTTIQATLRSILFLSIPSTVGLIILGFPIIQVVLQHGRYGLQEAQDTALPLAFFAIGLSGLAAVEILSRSFYAMRDSITPVVVSVAQFGLKIVLSLILINLAGVWGPVWGLGALAVSTSVAGLLEAWVLLWLLQKRIGSLQLRRMGWFVLRVLAATVAMGLCILIMRVVLDLMLVTTQGETLQLGGKLLALLKLMLEMLVGLFVYIRVTRYLGIEELAPLKRVLDRLKLSWI